nr:hydroxyethylthiazole kinase [Bifidobacterium simiarum]
MSTGASHDSAAAHNPDESNAMRGRGTDHGETDHGAHDPNTNDPKTNRNLPINNPLRGDIAAAVTAVRASKPLAQSLTNFVTINLVANAQLAVGGAAAMHYSAEEAHALNQGASKATYINMGTLLEEFRDQYPAAARDTVAAGLPWVLDPVGAGAGELRTAILRSFVDCPPAIVRCNASEAIALAGIWGLDVPGAGRAHAGVESSDEVEAAVPAAHAIARFTGGVVSVSGAVDLVTDGSRDFYLPGGSVWLTKITGAGCSLGGVSATYACVAEPLVAALAAALHYNRAADTAERVANGPASFQTAFIDALWNTSADEIAQSTIFI